MDLCNSQSNMIDASSDSLQSGPTSKTKSVFSEVSNDVYKKILNNV